MIPSFLSTQWYWALWPQNELGHTVPAFGQQREVSGSEEKCWESRKEKEIRVGEVREGFLEEAGP